MITPTLTVREPAVEELGYYLQSVYPDDFYGTDETTKVIYEDVDGDKEKDLIVDHFLAVFILLWSGEHYTHPFRIQHPYWKYDPSSIVRLVDWTKDGVPEVVFDYRGDTGGTGIITRWWTRTIIHCTESACAEVWEEPMGGQTNDSNLGGTEIDEATLRLSTNDKGAPVLRYLHKHFSISCCALIYDPVQEFPFGHLNVYTSTLSVYTWNGSGFDLTDHQIVSLPRSIASQASLAATNADGTLATISAASNQTSGEMNDFCQLFLNGKPTGSRFGCNRYFTTVEWKDITNDGYNEVVITAFSAAYPHDIDYNILSDVSCAHQHLLAHKWDGQNVAEVADVSGCVVQDDLYGVRIEDFDTDGQVEILAADNWSTPPECRDQVQYSCWYELGHQNQIYKYNGVRFVLWSTVPSE